MSRSHAKSPCYLIFDNTVHRTVGVIPGTDMDPDILGEDPMSWILTSYAAANWHELIALPYSGAYGGALKRFHTSMWNTARAILGQAGEKPGDIALRQKWDQSDMSIKKPRDRQREDARLKQNGRKYRTERLSKTVRDDVIRLRRNGMSFRKIAERKHISVSSVQRILDASKSEA